MMFSVKKVIGQILSPLPVCLELMVVGVVCLWVTGHKRLGQGLVSVGLVLLFLLSTEAISGRLLHTLESQYDPLVMSQLQDVAPRSAPVGMRIVVLAGRTVGDASLPLHLQISHASRERLLEGVRLYHQLPGSRLVLTGGMGLYTDPETTVLSRVAQTYGVEREDIILEVNSRDTKDHPVYLSTVVGSEPFILVTSAYHMPRAMKMFHKAKCSPIPAPVGHWKMQAPFSFSQLFPGISGLHLADLAVHEYLGLAWAWLQGQI